MDNVKKFLRFFLGIPITILSFLFIGKVFIDNFDTILPALSTVNVFFLFLGLIFFVIYFLLKSYIWVMILAVRGHDVDVRRTLSDYSFSEIKRYVPGSVFAVIGRLQTHSHLSKKETLKGIGIEAFLLVFSAFIVSIPAIQFVSSKTPISFLILIGSVLMTVVLAYFVIKLQKRVAAFLKPLLLYIFAWAIYSLACFFILVSLFPVSLVNLPTILSIFTLSWLVGYLSFVTPMGLGVREVATIFMLSFFMPVGIATSVSVVTRIGMMVGEIAFLFFAALSKRRNFSLLFKTDLYLLASIGFSSFYFLIFSILSTMKHHAFNSGRFDLGNMVQTVWNTSRGNFFMLTNPDGVEQISRLGVHSDLFLVLFTPFYLLWSDPSVLLIGQTFFIALGGVFIYLLSQKVTKNKPISLALCISYLLNFWLHYQNLFDFHAVSLSTGLLIGAFYFFVKKKYFYFSILLLLVLLTKENAFLVAAIFGIFIFFRQSRLYGGLLAVASIAIFFFLTIYLIPHSRGSEHFAFSYFSYLGDSPIEIFTNAILKPHALLSHLFSNLIYVYYHNLLLPLGYLPVLSPVYLLFALPDLLIYTFSSNAGLRTYYYHYGALILPFIYISSIYTCSYLLKKFKSLHFARALLFYILGFAIFSAYSYSPLPGIKEKNASFYQNPNSEKIKEYLSIIPPYSSVSASNNIGPHLSERERIYVVPRGYDRAEFIVLFKEKDRFFEEIDPFVFEAIIEDRDLDFYIYKRKIIKLNGRASLVSSQ